PLSPDNPVKNYLNSFLRENIYNVDDNTTFVSKYIQLLSTNLARSLYDIRQIKNENYLTFTVENERKIRSEGPFDRLNEEGAYEIIRVGRGASSANARQAFFYTEFPYFPITLQ